MNRNLRVHNQTDDEDDAFENGVLKDGRTYRVSLRFLDSTQRSVREHFGSVDIGDVWHCGDAATQLGLATDLDFCRPGFRFCTDAAVLDAQEQAYREHDEAEVNRWRSGSGNDSASDLSHANARDSLPITDARKKAYALADWEAENAWRGREWLDHNRPE